MVIHAMGSQRSSHVVLSRELLESGVFFHSSSQEHSFTVGNTGCSAQAQAAFCSVHAERCGPCHLKVLNAVTLENALKSAHASVAKYVKSTIVGVRVNHASVDAQADMTRAAAHDSVAQTCLDAPIILIL